MKILRPKLNLASFYSEEVEKAYTEGVYSDTPSNRKLGRVGMSYKDFAEKSHKTKDKKEKDMVNRIPDILDESEVLGKAEGKRLDAIIKYSNSDNLDGIKVDKDAINEKKRITIAKFYIKSAELEGSNKEIADALDGICEDALSDYSLEDENYFNISNTLKKQINKEFDNLLKEVNLSEVDKDDLFQTMYDSTVDLLKNEYHKAEDRASKKGNRDFNKLNEKRDLIIKDLIKDYLNKNKARNKGKEKTIFSEDISELSTDYLKLKLDKDKKLSKENKDLIKKELLNRGVDYNKEKAASEETALKEYEDYKNKEKEAKELQDKRDRKKARNESDKKLFPTMSKIGEDRRIHSLLSKEDFYKKDASKLDKKKVSDSIQKFTDYDVLDNRDHVWNLIDRGGDDGEEKSFRIYGKSLDKILKELNNI